MNLDRLRKRVRHYIDQQQYQSALFWADKIASLSHEDPQDIYWLAQCLYLTSQYHRASHALRSRKLDKLYGACQYLAARCHYAAKEYQQALDILGMEEPASKKLLDRSMKEDNCIKDTAKEWELSPASVSRVHFSPRTCFPLSGRGALLTFVGIWQLFLGPSVMCHLPMLYIGLEYGLTNNSKLAERFFSQALSIAPEDPFVIHEVAVVAFQNGDWKTAEKYFLDAMDKIKAIGNEVTVDKWEPLLNNLGHVCRKLKKYDQALEYHRQALVLIPQHASTYSAIGYVHSLMGDFESAIDYFHTALGLKRDDTFSVTMLSHCIEMYISDTDAYIGTEIKDKVRSTISTPALMKILNTSADGGDSRPQTLEESAVMETPTPNPDKSGEAGFLRSLPLECDMYESDMMLETSMSDTST
uniref:Cell division cycle protein 16 homolog n=1 Tax=Denticeps clupeoides TaxID=299321 RepID=A0AAY4EDT2_9TELE